MDGDVSDSIVLEDNRLNCTGVAVSNATGIDGGAVLFPP
jgi:hypothetical protein